jgi:hypothetical protein
MAMKRWIPTKKFNPWLHLVYQKGRVMKHFPGFKCTLCARHGILECVGDIQPCPDCDTYKIRIKLAKEGVPTVKIIAPAIHPEAAIHMYANGSLCLYDHREQPWWVDDNIHEKIIPWTAEWLVYYELYKLDGVWLGPEAPHGATLKKPQKAGSVSRAAA